MGNKIALSIIILSALIPHVVVTVTLLLYKRDLSVAMFQADQGRYDDALTLVQVCFWAACSASVLGVIVGMHQLMRGRVLMSLFMSSCVTVVSISTSMIFFWVLYAAIGGRL